VTNVLAIRSRERNATTTNAHSYRDRTRDFSKAADVSVNAYRAGFTCRVIATAAPCGAVSTVTVRGARSI
jgi:hypothetical protein